MAKTQTAAQARQTNAQPHLRQRAGEIQAYRTVTHMPPLQLEGPVRLEMTDQLNQLLAEAAAQIGVPREDK